MNKKKIINDPVYGFLRIPYGIVFDIIEHPYFQRLRHIQQLGLTSYVYPGALHTRFHHVLGAAHLMTQAIEVLRSKKVEISKKEAKAAIIAILMHDIGHGPFSHALEHSLVAGISHETLSVLFMNRLNKIFKGKLSLAIDIFEGNYQKQFLHELVSSQLDVDRLDYLNRDSFFTGVREGTVGSDRLIQMLNVHNNHLVVEVKGIYSVEQFIIARRLMYWQVYLHKTVLVAEVMLLKILQRAKELTQMGHQLFATPAFQFFLQNNFALKDFQENPSLLDKFASLGDADIFTSIKVWQDYPDFVLSLLCKGITNRQLLKIEMYNEPMLPEKLANTRQKVMAQYQLSEQEVDYIVFADSTSNSAYSYRGTQINIQFKDGSIKNVTEASDHLNISMLATPVVKHYFCYPKK